jgi:hypothetical protein
LGKRGNNRQQRDFSRAFVAVAAPDRPRPLADILFTTRHFIGTWERRNLVPH